MILLCPVCSSLLKHNNQAYQCENNHSFDVSKEGYTNLLMKSSKQSGDNKEMVLARTHFLEKGFYQPLLECLIDIVESYNPKVVVDAGCGEGYYTNELQKHCNVDLYAFDMSKAALRYGARRNKMVTYILSSIFHLPVLDASADVVLNIFAPCASEEFTRILKQDGVLIKVDPNTDHLKEMKECLYEDPYDNERKEVTDMKLLTTRELRFDLELDNMDIKHLFMMTPYYYKTSKESSESLLKMDKLTTTASFVVSVYTKQ